MSSVESVVKGSGSSLKADFKAKVTRGEKVTIVDEKTVVYEVLPDDLDYPVDVSVVCSIDPASAEWISNDLPAINKCFFGQVETSVELCSAASRLTLFICRTEFEALEVVRVDRYPALFLPKIISPSWILDTAAPKDLKEANSGQPYRLHLKTNTQTQAYFRGETEVCYTVALADAKGKKTSIRLYLPKRFFPSFQAVVPLALFVACRGVHIGDVL